MSLSDMKEQIQTCMSCLKMCRDVCPVSTESGKESDTPSGKMAILFELINGRLDWTPETVMPFYRCTQCGRCKETCELHIDVPQIILAARREAIKRDIILEPPKKLLNNILTKGNVYGVENSVRNSPIETLGLSNDGDSEILIYTGCKTGIKGQDTIERVVKILDKIGIKTTLLGGEELCCGSPLFGFGMIDEAKKVAQKNADVINSKGKKKIITLCPNCNKTLTETYEKFDIKIEGEVIYYVKFLKELINEGKIKLKKTEGGRTYSFHDPCKLRDVDIIDEPRFVLNSMVTNFKEMQRIGKNSFCCGNGSALNAFDKDLALKIGMNRMQEAKDLGIDVVVTSCQNCRMGLSDAGEQVGVEVKEITELLEMIE